MLSVNNNRCYIWKVFHLKRWPSRFEDQSVMFRWRAMFRLKSDDHREFEVWCSIWRVICSIWRVMMTILEWCRPSMSDGEEKMDADRNSRIGLLSRPLECFVWIFICYIFFNHQRVKNEVWPSIKNQPLRCLNVWWQPACAVAASMCAHVWWQPECVILYNVELKLAEIWVNVRMMYRSWQVGICLCEASGALSVS